MVICDAYGVERMDNLSDVTSEFEDFTGVDDTASSGKENAVPSSDESELLIRKLQKPIQIPSDIQESDEDNGKKMSDDRVKTLGGPVGSPIKPESRRHSRSSDRSAEGSSPTGSVGPQKKGKTAGARSQEAQGSESGTGSAPGGAFARNPAAAYDARSPAAAYDTRTPQNLADPRTSSLDYEARPPGPGYEARPPSAAYEGRGTPTGYDARSSAAPSRGPETVPEDAAESAAGTSAQPEQGSRRTTGVSGQATGGRSLAEEGAVNPNDAFNAEFSYYCAVLRTYAPSLSREYDKATTRLWMRKLFGPEYHPTVLKPKRNKYLLYLSITIYNDEAYGIFKQEPPCGKLPEITDIPFERDFPLAAWETEVQWTDTLSELPDELKMSECYLHDRDACPAPDEKLAGTLDAEFQFFLWLAKPYVTLLPDPEEKTTAACWIRLLCGVASQREDCVALKEIRNDYMQALLGYVHDLRVEGPFRLMPPAGPLPPLALLYEDCVEENGFADPGGNQAQEFLSIQRLPETGAFAYINVTGELFGNL